MVNVSKNKFLSFAVVLFAVIGGIWVLCFVLFRPVQHVLLCDANHENCKVAEAEFSYDSGDGQFVINKLYREDATITFSPIDCWVKVDGSACKSSLTGENTTGVTNTIIPLAYELKKWRWQRNYNY